MGGLARHRARRRRSWELRPGHRSAGDKLRPRQCHEESSATWAELSGSRLRDPGGAPVSAPSILAHAGTRGPRFRGRAAAVPAAPSGERAPRQPTGDDRDPRRAAPAPPSQRRRAGRPLGRPGDALAISQPVGPPRGCCRAPPSRGGGAEEARPALAGRASHGRAGFGADDRKTDRPSQTPERPSRVTRVAPKHGV